MKTSTVLVLSAITFSSLLGGVSATECYKCNGDDCNALPLPEVVSCEGRCIKAFFNGAVVKGCEDTIPALLPYTSKYPSGCDEINMFVIKADFCVCDSFLCNNSVALGPKFINIMILSLVASLAMKWLL